MNRFRLGLRASFVILALGGIAHADDLILRAGTLDHPHVRALLDGHVKVQGCDLHLSTHTRQDLTQDINGARQFDVVEVDIARYLERRSAGELTEYVLIPVFLTREFQLRNIYIRNDRGIHSAGDLRGKTIGVSGIGSVTSVWIQGILQSSWSIKPGDVTWKDAESSSGSVPSLFDWIESGSVDAIFSPAPPPGLDKKDSHVTRLFENYQAAEFDTFKTTRIFPIGTALAIRTTIAEANPWVTEALFVAFSESKKAAMADLTFPLPWDGQHLQETEDLMGKNFWSYGVKSNPKTLGALFRYLQEQGRLKQPLKAEDAFDISTQLLLEN